YSPGHEEEGQEGEGPGRHLRRPFGLQACETHQFPLGRWSGPRRVSLPAADAVGLTALMRTRRRWLVRRRIGALRVTGSRIERRRAGGKIVHLPPGAAVDLDVGPLLAVVRGSTGVIPIHLTGVLDRGVVFSWSSGLPVGAVTGGPHGIGVLRPPGYEGASLGEGPQTLGHIGRRQVRPRRLQHVVHGEELVVEAVGPLR